MKLGLKLALCNIVFFNRATARSIGIKIVDDQANGIEPQNPGGFRIKAQLAFVVFAGRTIGGSFEVDQFYVFRPAALSTEQQIDAAHDAR